LFSPSAIVKLSGSPAARKYFASSTKNDASVDTEFGAGTQFDAKISVYELLGAEVLLYFDYAGSHMVARVDPRTEVKAGDTVKFALEMEKTHFFDKETEKTITN
jgi:multiple sugar transport system ATP-binding protein